MNALDAIEIWVVSLRSLFEKRGVLARFERSPTERLTPSCSLNLQATNREVDLLVWETGEAELALAEMNEAPSQKHFYDVRSPHALAEILALVIVFILAT